MAKTSQFELPLVMPAQAQKHVTVNTALARLDAVVQLRVRASSIASPPEHGSDGEAYIVPAGAVEAWAGRRGQIAIWSNGGWDFISPKAGWKAWDESAASFIVHDGSDWVPGDAPVSPGGATTRMSVREFDHEIEAGAFHFTSFRIPKFAQVIAISGRVLEPISGPGLSTWRVGVEGATRRYATDLGTARNSFVIGITGSPTTYYEDTPLRITADSGDFASGTVRFALHMLEIQPPREI